MSVKKTKKPVKLKEFTLSDKRFLVVNDNRNIEENSTVSWYVRFNPSEKERNSSSASFDANLNISDCTRVISIDFNVWLRDSLSGSRKLEKEVEEICQNRIDKLDNLIGSLLEMRKALEKAKQAVIADKLNQDASVAKLVDA